MNARETIRECRLTHWAEVIRQRTESGLTVKEFCKERGLGQDQYFYWQRILRDSACERLVKNSAQIGPRAQMFTEVTIANQLIESPTQANDMHGQIRVEAFGVRISADSSYPTGMIAALLRELAPSC